jgi:hypothetical protein
MKGVKNVDKYISKMTLDRQFGRTPGFPEEDLAAAWKASKVFPVIGALMAPTIPGHMVNIKGWNINSTKFTGLTMGRGRKLLAVEPNSYRYTSEYC